MKNSGERDSVCPASVSQTYDDVSGFRIDVHKFFAADREAMKNMGRDEQSAYLERLILKDRRYDSDKVVDIYSKGGYAEELLSNFSRTSIILDGVQIHSMEGFLQSLKTKDETEQRRICLLVGKEAKEAGLHIEGWDGKTLCWQTREIDRFGKEYHRLLEMAYEARL